MISFSGALWGVIVPGGVSAGYRRGLYWINRVSHRDTICVWSSSLYNGLPFCFRENLSHDDMNVSPGEVKSKSGPLNP